MLLILGFEIKQMLPSYKPMQLLMLRIALTQQQILHLVTHRLPGFRQRLMLPSWG
jgi:hypothetical protein